MTNKTINYDEELASFGYKPELSRILTTTQLTSFGLTYLQPIGPAVIFGFLLTTSNGSVALPYLIAFIGMIFTVFSYSVLIKKYPLSGSIYNYVKYIGGPFYGFIAGWLLMLDYILIPTITSVSAAIFAHELIPIVSYELWLFGFVVTMGALNILGIKPTAFLYPFTDYVDIPFAKSAQGLPT